MENSERIKEGILYAEKQMNAGTPEILKEIISEKSKKGKVKVLDFGSGFGGNALNCAKLPNCEVHGVDIDDAHIMVSKCMKEKYDVQNVFFEKRNLVTTPFGNGEKFDVIMLNDVVEHVSLEILPSILNALRNCLASDGKLYFGYPPWEGPYAAHVFHTIKVPWIQYLPERMIKWLISKYNKEIIGVLESDLMMAYNGLNHITHRKMMKLLAKSNFQPVLRKSHCILNNYSLFKNWNFGKTPFKFLVTYEVLVSGKASPA